MHRRAHLRRSFRALVAAAVLTAAGPVAASATDPIRLELQLRDGRLSAHVVGAPFTRVMAEIATLSGASVTGVDAADVAPTTVTFSDLPLADALERLLQGRNHLLVYANDARGVRVRRIVLLAGGTTDSTHAARPAESGQTTPDDARGAESDRDQVDPLLAGSLDLLTSALALGDPAIRLQLLDEVATWQLDEPSRAVLLARLSGDPDEDVREAALRILQAGRPNVTRVTSRDDPRGGHHANLEPGWTTARPAARTLELAVCALPSCGHRTGSADLPDVPDDG